MNAALSRQSFAKVRAWHTSCDNNQTRHCAQQVSVHIQREFSAMYFNRGEPALCLGIDVRLPQE